MTVDLVVYPEAIKAIFRFRRIGAILIKLPPIIEKITGQAGTAIIFTEALTHGTLPWLGKDDRRTIFYKYSPHTLSWAAQYYDADDYTDLTERQREILEAPNARYKERKEFYLNYPNKKQ